MKTGSWVRTAWVVCVGALLSACANAPSQPSGTFDARRCKYLKAGEPGFGPNFPNSDDYRPKGQGGGSSVFNVCVASNGAMVGEPTVVTSSGNELIDRAGVAMLKDGTYCPAIETGQPVERCFKVKTLFAP